MVIDKAPIINSKRNPQKAESRGTPLHKNDKKTKAEKASQGVKIDFLCQYGFIRNTATRKMAVRSIK